jgi:hypothetical protein
LVHGWDDLKRAGVVGGTLGDAGGDQLCTVAGECSCCSSFRVKSAQKKKKFSCRNGEARSPRIARKNFAYSRQLCPEISGCAFPFATHAGRHYFAEGHYYLGDYYFQRGSYPRAKQAYEAALTATPHVLSFVDHTTAQINYAGVLLAQGMLDDADTTLAQLSGKVSVIDR